MTPRDIAHLRLANQQISASFCKTPLDVVKHLTAMQGQDFNGALWSIGLRIPGATRKAVEQAIAERTIVRTWPMRGTLHFIAAEDVRWMLGLLTPRILSGRVNRHEELELDNATFAKCEKVFVKALSGGNQLTRDQMYQALTTAKIHVNAQRGYHILWRLAQEQVLCFGCHSGKQPTFALLDEWIPTSRTLARDQALKELATRYFNSHGPATVHDFAWWSGLKISDARAAVEMSSVEIIGEMVEGKTYYMARNLPVINSSAKSTYALPGFDEFMLGYQDRSISLDPAHAGKIIPGSNGVFMPTVVHDGQVIGTWRATIKKRAIAAAHSPFASFNKQQTRGYLAAVQRYEEFLGL